MSSVAFAAELIHLRTDTSKDAIAEAALGRAGNSAGLLLGITELGGLAPAVKMVGWRRFPCG